MFRYVLSLLFITMYSSSSGVPMVPILKDTSNGSVANALSNLASYCPNPFLSSRITAKLSECDVKVPPYNEKEFVCLIFYDINRRLCKAASMSKIAFSEQNYTAAINEEINIVKTCQIASDWTFNNLTEFPGYQKTVASIFNAQITCVKICGVEDLLSQDTNFFCKYFKWGYSKLQKAQKLDAGSFTHSIVKTSDDGTSSIVGNNNQYVSAVPSGSDANVKNIREGEPIPNTNNEVHGNVQDTIVNQDGNEQISNIVQQKGKNVSDKVQNGNKLDPNVLIHQDENENANESQQGNNANPNEVQQGQDLIPNEVQEPINSKDSLSKVQGSNTATDASSTKKLNDDNVAGLEKSGDLEVNIHHTNNDKPKSSSGTGIEVNNDGMERPSIVGDENAPRPGETGGIGRQTDTRNPGISNDDYRDSQEVMELDDDDNRQSIIQHKQDNGVDTSIMYNGEKDLTGYSDDNDAHFFSFFLTAIILVVVIYVLYHNKNKVTKILLGLIVEGRQPGRRRNSRGHAYRRLDTLEQAMSNDSAAPPSKIIY